MFSPYGKSRRFNCRLSSKWDDYLGYVLAPGSYLLRGILCASKVLHVVIQFFRVAQCKSNIPLSRRVDLLERKFLEDAEPSLSFSDVWSLIRPYWFCFLAAIFVSGLFHLSFFSQNIYHTPASIGLLKAAPMLKMLWPCLMFKDVVRLAGSDSTPWLSWKL